MASKCTNKITLGPQKCLRDEIVRSVKTEPISTFKESRKLDHSLLAIRGYSDDDSLAFGDNRIQKGQSTNLPHKKRITRRYSGNKNRPKSRGYLCNNSEILSKSKIQSSEEEVTELLKISLSYICEICKDEYYTQWEFYLHLKTHYENKSLINSYSVFEEAEHDLTGTFINENKELKQTILPQCFNVSVKNEPNQINCSDQGDDDEDTLNNYDEIINSGFTDSEDVHEIFEGIRNAVEKVQMSIDSGNENECEIIETPNLTLEGGKITVISVQDKQMRDINNPDDPHDTEDLPDIRLRQYIARSELPTADILMKVVKQVEKRNELELKDMVNHFVEINLTSNIGIEKKRRCTYKCKICFKTCNSKNSFHYHFMSHTGERPYQCDVCGKSFFARNALKVHVRLHSGDKPYSCDVCSRKFRQWGDLQYHISSLHSSQKNHQCEYCGKEFARKYSLVIHRRIHTGERNYKCEFCLKSFRASSYLNDHRRIHTGEKPYICKICDKKFRVRGDLKRHLNIHARRVGGSIVWREETKSDEIVIPLKIPEQKLSSSYDIKIEPTASIVMCLGCGSSEQNKTQCTCSIKMKSSNEIVKAKHVNSV